MAACKALLYFLDSNRHNKLMDSFKDLKCTLAAKNQCSQALEERKFEYQKLVSLNQTTLKLLNKYKLKLVKELKQKSYLESLKNDLEVHHKELEEFAVLKENEFKTLEKEITALKHSSQDISLSQTFESWESSESLEKYLMHNKAVYTETKLRLQALQHEYYFAFQRVFLKVVFSFFVVTCVHFLMSIL